jgi:hypothetical protein
LRPADNVGHQSDRDSFAKRCLDPEPDCPDEAGHDHGDHSLEGVTLRLLGASSPPSKMLKIGAKLSSILLLDAERGESGRNRFQNHSIDLIVPKFLLFGQRLKDDGSDILRLRPVTA